MLQKKLCLCHLWKVTLCLSFLSDYVLFSQCHPPFFQWYWVTTFGSRGWFGTVEWSSIFWQQNTLAFAAKFPVRIVMASSILSRDHCLHQSWYGWLCWIKMVCRYVFINVMCGVSSWQRTSGWLVCDQSSAVDKVRRLSSMFEDTGWLTDGTQDWSCATLDENSTRVTYCFMNTLGLLCGWLLIPHSLMFSDFEMNLVFILKCFVFGRILIYMDKWIWVRKSVLGTPQYVESQVRKVPDWCWYAKIETVLVISCFWTFM